MVLTQHPVLNIASSIFPIQDQNYIIPYSMNLILMKRFQEDPELQNINDIEDYIHWVFDNLNYPDKYGLTGSIYDFTITRSGVEVPMEIYDSVDSYSATFLVVLNEFFKLTNDKELISAYKNKIDDIAYTIIYLQDNDGLTVAIPNTKTKYLMDNCEVYLGLQAYIELSESMNWECTDYIESREKMKRSINDIFFNKTKINYNWAVDEVIHESDWDVFYPDSYAQLFPILFGLLDEKEELKSHLWSTYYSLYADEELPAEQEIIVSMTAKRMEK
jgi:hypothetical protein